MEVFDYLLGKKSGGGGTPNLQEKSIEITQSGTQIVTPDEEYDGLSKVNITTDVQPSDINDYFKTTYAYGDNDSPQYWLQRYFVKKMPPLTIPRSIEYLQNFGRNGEFTVAPKIIFGNQVYNIAYMFYNCKYLKSVDLSGMDVSNVVLISSMFYNCSKLNDDSLNSILDMCTRLTSYTGTKNLDELGFTASTIASSRWQSLSNYQAFLDAGWVIGY